MSGCCSVTLGNLFTSLGLTIYCIKELQFFSILVLLPGVLIFAFPFWYLVISKLTSSLVVQDLLWRVWRRTPCLWDKWTKPLSSLCKLICVCDILWRTVWERDTNLDYAFWLIQRWPHDSSIFRWSGHWRTVELGGSERKRWRGWRGCCKVEDMIQTLKIGRRPSPKAPGRKWGVN